MDGERGYVIVIGGGGDGEKAVMGTEETGLMAATTGGVVASMGGGRGGSAGEQLAPSMTLLLQLLVGDGDIILARLVLRGEGHETVVSKVGIGVEIVSGRSGSRFGLSIHFVLDGLRLHKVRTGKGGAWNRAVCEPKSRGGSTWFAVCVVF